MSSQKPIIHRLGLRESILFFGPLALMFAVYYVFSTGFLFYTSLQRISMSLVNGKWIGLQNFVLLFTDHRFLKAFVNNLVFAGVSIGAALTLGFFIAVTLSATWRARTLLYTIFLLPALMPLSLVASVFRTLLEARFGSVNVLLSDIGLGWMAQNWLIDPTLAYGVVIILFVYIIGLPVLYYTANLSTINTSLIESAVIDGAGTWRLFVEILFPIMKGTHRTIVISTLLTSFRAFDIVFFSTGGGPAGATEITGTYVYAFSTTGANVGYGSAAAIATLLVTLVLSAIHMRFSGKDRHQ
jgi:raffinose/stachyose/melibiose transport system permease protein